MKKRLKIVNRRVYHEYILGERFEVGIVLTGAEVKSIREGRIQLANSFIHIKDGEAWLTNAQIPPYKYADSRDYDPFRSRRLLMHKKQLRILGAHLGKKGGVKGASPGLTIVPVSCYTTHHRIKLEIALAQGKKTYQKKEAIKRKDLERELQRELRGKDTTRG